MLAIGVDVASISGWAVVEDAHGRETLWEHGIVDVAMDTPLWEQIDRVLDKGRHVAMVALELPYLGDNPHVHIIDVQAGYADECRSALQKINPGWKIDPGRKPSCKKKGTS